MHRERLPIRLGIATMGMAALVAGCAGATSSQGESQRASSGTSVSPAASGSLVFPKDTYTTETEKVTTSTGSVTVTYHLYSAIPYVAKPVDTRYESLNVEVPVAIDGQTIDASGAPIVLNIPVGGYLSSAVGGGSGGAPSGGVPGGAMPSGGFGGAPSGGVPGGNGGQSGFAGQGGSGDADLALAAGYVVVTPGVRGRDNKASDGTYYGKAPAAIVDLKAAVRYIHANKGVFPGNTDWIISTGTSAGGALSAILGASGNSSLYDAALAKIGAANASDAIFAAAAYCPITDLDHADAIYEWTFGSSTLKNGGTVDQTISTALAAEFAPYVASLKLTAADGTAITADTEANYLLTTFLEPAAKTYLASLSDTARASYLASNAWITWVNDKATFSWSDFLAHIGRSKTAPAFDALDLSAAENIEFGSSTTNARHFTEFSLRKATGNPNAKIDADLPAVLDEMNPMYFIGQENAGLAKHWFLRVGTSDTDTSPVIVGDLAASLLNHGSDVDALMYWDAGHGVNQDPAAFIAWIAKETGYTK